MASAQYAKKVLSEEERWFYATLYSKGYESKVCEPIIEQNMDLMLYEVFRASISKYDDSSMFAKFDSTVSRLVSDAASSGTIHQNKGRVWLAEQAVPFAKAEWDALDHESKSAVFFAKRTYNNATRDEAKCCIYCEWPDLARAAGEHEWFEKNRKDLAFAFYKRKTIPLRSAAQIAVMAYVDFMDDLGKRGIPMM